MKNCTMRMAEPMPFGLTPALAITRAIVSASFLKRPAGGKVETVFTRADQRRLRSAMAARPQLPSASTQSRGTR
jgi:hypothetical protein